MWKNTQIILTFEEFILVNLQTFQLDRYKGHKCNAIQGTYLKELNIEIYDAFYDGNKYLYISN